MRKPSETVVNMSISTIMNVMKPVWLYKMLHPRCSMRKSSQATNGCRPKWAVMQMVHMYGVNVLIMATGSDHLLNDIAVCHAQRC